jgi:hypothetical protein
LDWIAVGVKPAAASVDASNVGTLDADSGAVEDDPESGAVEGAEWGPIEGASASALSQDATTRPIDVDVLP